MCENILNADGNFALRMPHLFQLDFNDGDQVDRQLMYETPYCKKYSPNQNRPFKTWLKPKITETVGTAGSTGNANIAMKSNGWLRTDSLSTSISGTPTTAYTVNYYGLKYDCSQATAQTSSSPVVGSAGYFEIKIKQMYRQATITQDTVAGLTKRLDAAILRGSIEPGTSITSSS